MEIRALHRFVDPAPLDESRVAGLVLPLDAFIWWVNKMGYVCIP